LSSVRASSSILASSRMPKLYYTPTSCGAASFIAAHVAGVKVDAEQVDLKTHKTVSGVDFYTVNAKGNVPTLVLDDGTVLNEGAAVLQYIADQAPGTIAPVAGSVGRYVNIANLNYVASEVHPSIGGLFNPTIGPEVKAHITANANKKLAYLEGIFSKNPGFLGGTPNANIADFYLYIVLGWTKYVGLSLEAYPHVQAYIQKVADLDGVKAAHALIATNPATTA